MLRILRNRKTAKKVWIGLAIIIIPAFTFWGFSGALRSRQESAPAGRIFGRNISYIQLRDAIAGEKIIARMQFGDKLDELQQYLDFEAQGWQRLVLLAEARKQRIAASDQEVIKDIESTPIFQSKGAFNNKIYNEVLRYYLRVQPRLFEELIRQNIILSKLYKQVTDKVTLNDEQIREEYAKAKKLKSAKNIDETAFAKEKTDFAKKLLLEKKQDYFNNFVEELNKKARR